MLVPSALPRVSRSVSAARFSVSGVGSSPALSSRSCTSLDSSVRSSLRRCPCGIYTSRTKAVVEAVESKASAREWRSAVKRAVLASDTGAEEEVGHSRSFLRARSEEELLSYIRKEVETGRLSSDIANGLEELYYNYRNAVLQSGDPRANKIILSNMAVAFDRILLDVEDPFTFSPHHQAIREPFDYYMFGQNYIRPLIDFRRSYIGNISIFSDMEEKLQQGHNIVLMSNHQTEADPAIIALLLERTNSHIAETMVFVAGDRVLTDPLCKPFSMGRNLLCVYSKKHMDDVPELIEMKRRANTRSLKEMALLLRGGSQIIWIAPSGGRDRPDPSTGEWHPAPFDVSSVDNMRRLVEHSSVPGHIYPLSLLCYEVMPPPQQVEKQIGERRTISFHGVGLSVAPELNFNELTAGCETPEEAKEAFSQALYNSVGEQYNVLKSAIHEHRGLNASNSIISLSQPWQ
ncbi:glycerol-3-phosphate acyltransferase, chloroplastic [Elaeis guineensis]|uniref:Glycerol-3-phosphate acyltransferase, chloroplastic n=2 Tax=Elaeis guineensis var. tenera TaxID=51953 RepID=Q9M4V1_ELAGV|nr:glycerol-3-phosphate acyltransferase, chloroplastic [Elaeis guineensis]AAF64066.1 glycerol-3-phosphate acyltransferase [Elaeis guineensis]